MFKSNQRYKNQQQYTKDKYNRMVNQTKQVNKVLNKRGGTKL